MRRDIRANLADGSLTDACWDALVDLCADVCRRNGVADCAYTGGTDGVLTMHRWYQETDCPGPWLSRQFERLSREVNTRLGGGHSPTPPGPRNNTRGGKLDVNGRGGYNTVLDMQHALGTYEDGVISGQWSGNKARLWGMEAVEWGAQGSRLVRALQELVGAVADGLWGEETSTKLQQHLAGLGRPIDVDGYFGRESVKALQAALNDGRFAA